MKFLGADNNELSLFKPRRHRCSKPTYLKLIQDLGIVPIIICSKNILKNLLQPHSLVF